MRTPKEIDQLEQYIVRLYELQEAKKQQVTAADLEAAARSVGLSDSEMKALEQASADQLRRAQSYTAIGRWDEAQREIEAALQLNYLRVEYLYAAAHFYHQKYNAQKKNTDLLRAEKYAKKCLDLVPDFQQASDVLQALDRRLRSRRRRRRALWGLLLLLSPFLAVFFYAFFRELFVLSVPSGLEGQRYEVPIELESSSELAGIEFLFSPGVVQHDESTGNRSFDFNFHCRVGAPRLEIVELGFHALFLDEKGRTVSDSYYWLVSEGSFSVRPNEYFYYRDDDHWAGNYFADLPTRIHRVRMQVHGIRTYSGVVQYPAADSLDVQWIAQPTHRQALHLAQRSSVSGVLVAEDQSMFHRLQIEIRNQGQQPFVDLVLAIQWFGPDSLHLDEQTYRVLRRGEPPLQPGQQMLFYLDRSLSGQPWNYPTPFRTYRVAVRSIE